MASIIVGVLIALGGFMFLLAQLGGGPFDLLAPTPGDDQEQSLRGRADHDAAGRRDSPRRSRVGPKGGAYLIDEGGGSVWRVNTGTGKAFEIVQPGDRPQGSDDAIGRPAQLADAGEEIVIVDDDGRLWRWQQENRKAAGTLSALQLSEVSTLPRGHGPLAAYVPAVGDYRLYVVDPAADQILRYQQTFGGGAFLPPSAYIERPDAGVDAIDQLHLDFDLYALAGNEIQRYQYGRRDWMWRPQDIGGTDYRLLSGSGRQSTDGRLYLYDAAGERIVGLGKAGGSALARWQVGDGSMADVRGMYVIEGGLNKRGERRNDTLVWVTPSGLYQARLRAPSDS